MMTPINSGDVQVTEQTRHRIQRPSPDQTFTVKQQPIQYCDTKPMSTTNVTTHIFTGEVILANTKERSTVVGNGGGFYWMPINITTHHQRVTELWVRLSDGTETRIDISGDFPALSGHRIAFLANSTHLWAARNFNTGSIYWFATIDWLAGKFRCLSHWIILAGFLPAIVCGFLIAELRLLKGNADNINAAPTYAVICLIGLTVIAIGSDIIRYFMHRKRVAMSRTAIDEGNVKLQNAS